MVVLPEDDGSGVVAGELAASGLHEFAIRRQSEQAGELMAHFSREDYRDMKAGEPLRPFDPRECRASELRLRPSRVAEVMFARELRDQEWAVWGETS